MPNWLPWRILTSLYRHVYVDIILSYTWHSWTVLNSTHIMNVTRRSIVTPHSAPLVASLPLSAHLCPSRPVYAPSCPSFPFLGGGLRACAHRWVTTQYGRTAASRIEVMRLGCLRRWVAHFFVSDDMPTAVAVSFRFNTVNSV